MKTIELSGDMVKTSAPFAVPLDTVTVNISPVQSGSGDPSPTNVRPISGWTGANVTRTGKNLAEKAHLIDGNLSVDVADDGTLTINGTSSTYCFIRGSFNCPDEAATYTWALFNPNVVASTGVEFSVRDSDTSPAGGLAVVRTPYMTKTFVPDSGKKPVYWQFQLSPGITFNNVVFKPMIVLGSIAPEIYKPYAGDTYDITFPSEAGMVYGGTLDVTTGLLTVTHGFHVCDGTDGWFDDVSTTTTADGTAYTAYMPKTAAKNMKNTGICPSIASSYAYNEVSNVNLHKGQFNTLNSYFRFVIADPSITSLSLWNAWLTNNPLQLCFELATPQTYQLAPTDVTLLMGDNNVWADTGEIGIAYRPYHRFIFDGVNSIDDGLYVFPTDSMMAAPARQYTEQVVPGRSGVLLMDDRRYDNILHEYHVVVDDDGQANIALLRNMLASRVGYCRLMDTFDTDHYYMAAYNQDFTPVLEWRRRDMAKAMISFYRKPQRFLLSGESAVVMTASGSITNPTRYKAKPFIRVYGSGVLGIGDTNITIASHAYSYMDIDCETGRAYYGATSLDSKVTLNAIDFPSLAPGSNGITMGSGITCIEITPRWWEL